MIMNFNSLIKPKSVEAVKGAQKVRELDKSTGRTIVVYDQFVVEPLPKGFGTTIGNSLRRMLISSVEGSAIVGFKMNGVKHEFDVVSGIAEDVVNISLNLKMVELKSSSAERRRVRIKKRKDKGQQYVVVTAADITGDVEVLNPSQHILTITGDGTEVDMELYVERGVGYVPVEEQEGKFDDVEVVQVDAVFTPIKRVNYSVGEARFEQRTDYDKLTIEVETDGSVTPRDAIAFAAKIVKDYLSFFINFEEQKVVSASLSAQAGDNIETLLTKDLEELELSVRASNCLKNAGLKKLWELCSRSEADMLRTKNFGRKSLDEIKVVLAGMNLGLDMDLTKYGYKSSGEEG
ncbi:DNA-directed RNA polymerase subunit alpha [Deferribacterales bacterium RsTz2092]